MGALIMLRFAPSDLRPMRYHSTRGHPSTPGFSDILLGGLAPDGGLYLPERYPQVTDQELSSWRHLPYAALAAEILKKFANSSTASALQRSKVFEKSTQVLFVMVAKKVLILIFGERPI